MGLGAGEADPQATHASKPPRGRVLLVEDEGGVRRAYARLLDAAGYAVTQAADGRLALLELARGTFEVILSDISMPGMSGTQLIRAVRARALDTPVLLITANPTVESAIAAVELGALGYLLKPVSAEALTAAVERAITLCRIARVEREAASYLGSMARDTAARASLEVTLEAALDGLWMAYQPIVSWTRREVVAYEALVRTRTPMPVPMGPEALLSLAERLGAVHKVGRKIRTLVAQTLTDRARAVDLFVNLHPSDLLDEELFAPHGGLAAFAGRVVLEVTEREAIEAGAQTAVRAERLRALGYRIAIDDLGAGYAGLSYFAQLSPEVVKLDMSLVRNVDLEPIKQKLVGALITLCRDLDMLVVAEGVETVGERDTVTALGCDLLQGYLFARPGEAFPEVRW